MNNDLKEYINNKFLYVNLKNINNNKENTSIIVGINNDNDIYNLINLNSEAIVSDINGDIKNINFNDIDFKNSFFKLNNNL